MKKLLFIPLCALLLASCGQDANMDTTQSQNVQTDQVGPPDSVRGDQVTPPTPDSTTVSE